MATAALGGNALKNVTVNAFADLSESVLGVGLFTAINAAVSAAGALTGVIVIRGIFGEEVVDGVSQLAGLIGGSVIGFGAGWIALGFTGDFVAAFVIAFLVGALAAGIICLIVEIGKVIYGAISKLWNWIMDKFCSYAPEVIKAIQNGTAKVAGHMCKMVSTVLALLHGLAPKLKTMDPEKKRKAIKSIEKAVDKLGDTVSKAIDECGKEIIEACKEIPDVAELIDGIMNEMGSTLQQNKATIKNELERM